MREIMQNFYTQLDQSYATGGIPTAEQFLLSYTKSPANEQVCIAAWNELGSLYRGTSRFPQSLAAFEQSLALAETVFGPTQSEYATILVNMAGTCRLAEDHDKAIELFKQAIAIYSAAGEDNSYLYANVWNNLSLAYRDAGQLEHAMNCLEQALSIIEVLPGYRQELAITYNNLAALAHAKGDRERTAFCLRRAMEEFDACADEENVHYAAGLNSLASVLYSTGAYEQALDAFRKSAQYTLHFFGKNLEYAITYQNISRVYEALNQPTQVLDALQHAREVYETLMGADHPRTVAVKEEIAQLRKEHAL